MINAGSIKLHEVIRPHMGKRCRKVLLHTWLPGSMGRPVSGHMCAEREAAAAAEVARAEAAAKAAHEAASAAEARAAAAEAAKIELSLALARALSEQDGADDAVSGVPSGSNARWDARGG